MSNSERGREFEEFVSDLMAFINECNNLGFEVMTRPLVKDYEIDVVLKKRLLDMNDFGFDKHIEHFILIECKYWNKKVDRDTIITVDGKVKRIPGSSAIVIAKLGFQSGAIEEADRCGVDLMTADQLPTLVNVLGRSMARQLIKSCVIPESQRGEPFWCLMHDNDNSTVSGIRALIQDFENSESLPFKKMAPLFFSPVHAKSFIDDYKLESTAVRGLSQEHLRQFFLIACVVGDGFFLALRSADGSWVNSKFDESWFIGDYLYAEDSKNLLIEISKLRESFEKEG